jgi:hypothetical protein
MTKMKPVKGQFLAVFVTILALFLIAHSGEYSVEILNLISRFAA